MSDCGHAITKGVKYDKLRRTFLGKIKDSAEHQGNISRVAENRVVASAWAFGDFGAVNCKPVPPVKRHGFDNIRAPCEAAEGR